MQWKKKQPNRPTGVKVHVVFVRLFFPMSESGYRNTTSSYHGHIFYLMGVIEEIMMVYTEDRMRGRL